MNSSAEKLAFPALIALVVGSMVGGGVFSLPATFGRATGVMGALIAWTIAGAGMLSLAFVFQNLSMRKPNLDAGLYAYAKEGFGSYLGFCSALGFWAVSCIGNVSYFILLKATLGAFFPIFGDGNTLIAVGISSMLLWGFHLLILQGVKGATAINTIVTIAKVVPIIVFLVVLFFVFDSQIFAANFFGQSIVSVDPASTDLFYSDQYGYVGHSSAMLPAQNQLEPESLFAQIRHTMLITVFVFVGIEGASVYSRYARKRKQVGLATVLGFLGVLFLFMLVTILPYGILLRPELAQLRQPSMAGVLEAVVGRWGTIFISAGLTISVLGAYLSWSLLAAEMLFSAAKNNTMPKFLAYENVKKVPAAAVWLTSSFIQVFLIVALFSDYAFVLAVELTSSLALIPYFFVALYALKLVCKGETYESQPRRKDFLIAAIACIYTLGMLYAGGLKYILLSSLIYVPGTLLYIRARREQNQKIFTQRELTGFLIAVLIAITALLALLFGNITI